jgi:hypothetical protein
MGLERFSLTAAKCRALLGLAIAILLFASPPSAAQNSQDIPAMNQRIQEIDQEIRKAKEEIMEVERKIQEIDREIQENDRIIKKAAEIISLANEKHNAQAEAAARDAQRNAQEARRKNVESRAGLEASLRKLGIALEAARAREPAWKRDIRELIAERLSGKPDPLTVAVLDSLDDPSKRLRPISKRFSDLSPGDVLLVAPEEGWGLDALKHKTINLADKLTSWECDSQAYHTFIYLKTVNGKKLFLDNLPNEGPLIKNEDQILKEYGKSSMDVAQPLSEPDGDKLWEAAKKLQKGNLDRLGKGVIDETGYGLYGNDNMVCSETSRWALVQAGVPVPGSKSLYKRELGIYIGPANFYSQKQNFLIAAVEMPGATSK